MGYFAGRSAPMGAVEPAVVTATFNNFAPRLVARALPDAWGFASPARVLEARLAGIDRAFGRISVRARRYRRGGGRRHRPPGGGERHRRRPTAGGCQRRLAVADRSHARPVAGDDDPAGASRRRPCGRPRRRRLNGLEAHISFVGAGGVSRQVLQPARGWSDEEWGTPSAPWWRGGGWTRNRSAGKLTPVGVAARQRIEEATDRLAVEPWRTIGDEATEELRTLLKPMAARIAELGLIPVLNPIGLRQET